jgi:protein-disulfide isomerase
MKHVNWILALVVGLAIGFFSRSALVGTRPGPAPQAAAPRPPRPQEDPRAVYRVALDDSPARGPADALVTIVVSSDFECPFCKRVEPTLQQLDQAYPGKLRWVFKHNPLPMHPRAMPAALAAEAAREQKGDAGFWTMHDALFELSPRLDDAGLEKAATETGLDLTRYRAAMASKAAEPRIRRDQEAINAFGATGTPAFFINGRKLVGARPIADFRALIDEELQKASALVAEGTPASAVYARITGNGATSQVLLPQAPQPAAPPAAPGAAAAAPTAPAAPAAPVAPAAPSPYRKVPLRADDPARGPADAKLTVVLFSDFQCPFCARVEPSLKQLEEAYPGQVRIVWKQLPLPMHPNAMPAALASEAAREQGKFWPMHDLLIANQQALGPADLERYARQLGLDLRRFKAAQGSAAAQQRVDQDKALADSIGATGTPNMFFNCRQVVGAQPYPQLKAAADDELKKVDALLAKGAKRDAGLYLKACDANLASAPAAAAAAPAPGQPVKIDLRPDDPVKGNPRAPVTVVLFSDFQCPFCSRVEPTLKQLEQAYPQDVRLAWKHKPLPFHPNAMPAAMAAEAAREQGKFWPMHDKMFAAQQELSAGAYERWARELGLDLARFRAGQSSPALRARIEADDQLAGQLGIDGTPTMVVNGEKVVGAVPYEQLKAVIDRKLAEARRK